MLSLLFGQGQRPDFGALDTLSRDGGGSLHFSISHQPDPDEGWLELLASGLTFDCRGLAPAPPQPVPPPGALLGLAEAPVGEAVSLSPVRTCWRVGVCCQWSGSWWAWARRWPACRV